MNKIHTLTDTGLLLISSPDNGGIRLCLLSEKSPISWFQTEAPRRVLQFPSAVSHQPTALCASVPCILFLIKAFFIIHLCLLPYHFRHLLSIQNFSVKVIVNHGRIFPDSICSIILSGCRKNNDHIIGFLSVNNCCIMLISEVIKKVTKKSSELTLQTLDFTAFNRGNRIWTCDLTAPSRARYQATPYPATEDILSNVSKKINCFFEKVRDRWENYVWLLWFVSKDHLHYLEKWMDFTIWICYNETILCGH